MMQNERDVAKSRRGSSPQQNAEEIYTNWLKRPRSAGNAPGTVVPDNQEPQKPDDVKKG